MRFNKKRTAIALLAMLAVAVAIVVVIPRVLPGEDDRTTSEKMILGASDLPGLNAYDAAAAYTPGPTPLGNGTEMAMSRVQVCPGAWSASIDCTLVRFNSSVEARRLTSPSIAELELTVGEAHIIDWDNDTIDSRIFKSRIEIELLVGDTLAYLNFNVYPTWKESNIDTIAMNQVGYIVQAQAEKIQSLQ